LCTLDERSTFPQTTGAEGERLFDLDLPERGMGDQAFAALTDVIGNSRAQNGRFFGYVQGSGEPIAALGDLLRSILNQNITAWRSSPAGVTIERTVVRWLSEAVGCCGFVGTLTSGGSAANLMGLAMARDTKTPANEHGLYNRRAGVIYASEQVHMAVPKAVAMLGIGRENLHYVPCDDSYRMVPSLLERAIRQDEAQGPQL
jgi:glutamate/tyrosine decarboxylase-like PLP-dependent enzyme